MAQINLYPTGQRQKLGWYRVSRVFQSLNFILTIIFFITVMILVGIIVLNQNAINQANSESENIRSRLKSLSEVESEYFFIKDRVKKADEILKTRKVVANLENLNEILQKVNNVQVAEAQLAKGKLSVSVLISDINTLKEFLSQARSLDYQRGVLDSLSFNPEKGYTVELVFE
jgi:hypothetical protein